MTTRTVRIAALSFIAVFAVLALAAIGATLMTEHRPRADQALPVLGEAPAFSLTNQAGDTITQKDLRGHVWVADFMFTRCGTICPILTANMAELQTWLSEQPGGEAVRLVSFSVDPAHDTPKVLREFAERYEANLERWHFLTAQNREAIWPMMRGGFKLPVSENPDNAAMPISHSARMVLIDEAGRIRGYYGGTKPRGQQGLRKELKQLLAR